MLISFLGETPVHAAVWITIFLILILFLNIIAVSFFGEAEFWFASIKLITIIGLIILSFVIMLGGSPNDQGRLGFRYWNKPGAFNPYMTSGSTGRFLAYWTAFVRAGFAFITSPELIALAAGEVNLHYPLKTFRANFSLDRCSSPQYSQGSWPIHLPSGNLLRTRIPVHWNHRTIR